jgi:hypothetical protein
MKDITMLNYMTRDEILDKYPINNTTYNNKVKLLINNPTDKNLTFIKHKKRFIDKTIVHKYFFPLRVPNFSQTEKKMKWLGLTKWDYFCCITPTSNNVKENIQLITEINKVLKNTFKLENSLLFYSMELYDFTEYFHIHFLMTFDKEIPIESIIKTLRKIPKVKDDVISRNRYPKPIDIQKYDHERFGLTGVVYNSKLNLKWGVLR